MALFATPRTGTVAESALANHMSQTFNYMIGGVGLSGLVAYLTYNTPALMQIAMQGGLIFMLVWLAFGFFMHKIVFSLSAAGGLAVFAAFAALTGFCLTPLVAQYTGASVASAFAIAAVMFAGASAYGYFTGKSLSGWGNFLMLGAWGLVGAVVVNLVVSLVTGSPIQGLSFVISLIAVPLFAAMTAWETNQIKETFCAYANDQQVRSRLAILSATGLYMNFVTMFIHLLNIIGVLRNQE